MKDRPQPARRRPGNVPGSRGALNTYYSARQGPSRSPFEKKPPKKTSRRLFIRLADYLFLLVILVLVLFSLVVRPDVGVKLNDDTYHQAGDYRNFIDNRVGGLADTNKITFNEQALNQQIRQAFPEVEQVSTELPIIGQHPIVNIVVAKPTFFIGSQGNYYLLSGNGVAVDLKSYYPKLTYLTSIDDESGFTIAKGKHVLSQQDISFLQSLYSQLNFRHIPIKRIVLPASPEEVDVYTNDAGYYTRFFMGGDPGLQVGQFFASRNSFMTQTPPSQYLDVRVSGKVFYK